MTIFVGDMVSPPKKSIIVSKKLAKQLMAENKKDLNASL